MVERMRKPPREEGESLRRMLSLKDVRIRLAVRVESTATPRLLTAEEYARFCVRPDDPVKRGRIDIADLEYGDIKKPDSRYRRFIFKVLEKICLDEYGRDSNTRLITAEPNTTMDGPQETYGAARLVLGNPYREHFIEAAQLFDFTKPLPHVRDGLGDEQVAELGRVVVSREHRPHNTRVILSRIMDGIMEISRQQNIKGIYITLPTKQPARLKGHIEHLGYSLQEVEGAVYSDIEYAREIRGQFPVYWEDMEPKLFYLRIPNRLQDLRRRRLLKKISEKRGISWAKSCLILIGV